MSVQYYWAAVTTKLFEASLFEEDGKVYYRFHGSELAYSTQVGEVIQAVTSYASDELSKGNEPTTWMVFQYVPSPSEMHLAVWEAMQGNVEKVTFKVRVYEKFSFPHPERGAHMRPVAGVAEELQELVDPVDSLESDF